jgi:hypothetical protein
MAINYTTNAIGFSFFIAKEYKTFQVKQGVSRNKLAKEMGKMPNDKYDIQELLQRDVYVNDKKVGKIVGERHHPNEARVRSMRLQVESDVG